MKLVHIFFTTTLIYIIAAVFRRWFLNEEIIGGDWQYIFSEMLKEFYFFPLSWDPTKGNGLGNISPIYPLSIYNNFTTFIAEYLNLPWIIVYKIFWFGLFIALSILSSLALLRRVLSNIKYWQLVIGVIVFTCNSYILMITGGGQMGVALAYSVAPIVLAIFIKLIDLAYFSHSTIKFSLIAGLVLALQVMFDTRITYVTMLAVGMYFLLGATNYLLTLKSIRNMLYVIVPTVVAPIGIAILIHASWIFPLFIFRQNPLADLGQSYTSSGIVQFLSFAHFSNALALLHPNWPENIFGKVYFMRPEFLFLPILAYSSLLFFKKSNKIIVFFVFLGLLGSFLAKGTNEPFGEAYIWLFEHVPGFVMFRDPTKWYLMIALSYSVLIPFSIGQIYTWFSSHTKFSIFNIQFSNKSQYINFQNVFFLFALFFLLFLIHPAIFGNLGGTFQKHEVPKEYVVLKDFLHNKSEFFRTLWIPSGVRFNYFSNTHLIVVPELLFGTKNISVITKKLHSVETKMYLQNIGIKYIIVPFDPMGEIFVKSRKYDEKQYEDTIKHLESISWLKRLHNLGRIAIFEIPNPKDRFWLTKNGKISYTMISPVDYDLTFSIIEPQNLIFSENYHPSWIATSDSKTFISEKTTFGLNSFYLPKSGNYSIKISFAQQKYYTYGQIISVFTLIIGVLAIIVLQKKKA